MKDRVNRSVALEKVSLKNSNCFVIGQKHHHLKSSGLNFIHGSSCCCLSTKVLITTLENWPDFYFGRWTHFGCFLKKKVLNPPIIEMKGRYVLVYYGENVATALRVIKVTDGWNVFYLSKKLVAYDRYRLSLY